MSDLKEAKAIQAAARHHADMHRQKTVLAGGPIRKTHAEHRYASEAE